MSAADSAQGTPSRLRIVRDVLIFQIKLWLEGFKDIVLMPLSLGAALIDLVFRRSRSRGALYSVMKMGDRFEQWVNLYAALDGPSSSEEHEQKITSLDDLLNEAADGIEQQTTSGPSGTSQRRGRERQ